MDIKIVDIIKHPEGHASSLFKDALKQIEKEQKDRNFRNYLNLDQKLYQFSCFHVAYNDDELILFSGLENKKQTPKVGRAMTRLYFAPKHRAKGIIFREGVYKQRTIAAVSFYETLAKQVNYGKDYNYEALYLSVEFLSRRKALRELIQRINYYIPEHPTWHILDKMALTCPDENSLFCWQNIAVLFLSPPFSWPFPTMSLTEWEKKFGEYRRSLVSTRS